MKARELIKFSLNPRIVEDPALPVGYIRNAYYNGVGRFVCQLQRVTIKFCKNSCSSRGVREFIENHMLDFTRQNPGVVIYLKPRLHRTPVIVSEYLNGQSHWMNVKNFSSTELSWWLNILRDRSGYQLTQLISNNNVLNPSVQGIWNPYLNRPTSLNGKEFPCEERSVFVSERLTATEQVMNLVEKYKLSLQEEGEDESKTEAEKNV